MTSKNFPFRLVLQRAGQNHPTSLSFKTREEMQSLITAQMKSHFIGSIIPQVWNGGEWHTDPASERMMASPDAPPERAALFAQCATFFKALAKEKGQLSPEQIDDLADLMTQVAGYVGDATVQTTYEKHYTWSGDAQAAGVED